MKFKIDYKANLTLLVVVLLASVVFHMFIVNKLPVMGSKSISTSPVAPSTDGSSTGTV